MNSIRVLISVVANQGWPLVQLDVKNVFLHRDLEDEVYMHLPPGFQLAFGKWKVCCLHKALYDLNQSPRAWFERFSGAMLKFGYAQCQADHTLFVKHSVGKTIALIVYVNDIVMTENDPVEIFSLKLFLGKEFEIKDLGSLCYFLSIEVSRFKKGIFLSQRKYVLDLLQETGLLGCRPCETPIEPNHHLHEDAGERLIDVGHYQRLVDHLIYLPLTRLDISYAVGVVSQFMHAPTTKHLEAVYRVFRY